MIYIPHIIVTNKMQSGHTKILHNFLYTFLFNVRATSFTHSILNPSPETAKQKKSGTTEEPQDKACRPKVAKPEQVYTHPSAEKKPALRESKREKRGQKKGRAEPYQETRADEDEPSLGSSFIRFLGPARRTRPGQGIDLLGPWS